ncbi:FMN reductase (NADH) NtaB [Mycobacterium attenuatum]|uniref:FMN reductase (NADH) NtaB n=1 Tax=Mycobacterium attenuatum TaxID=2341086 RepID=A0A498Q6Z5_9MYCO|nr:flavin reductase family protein [Mycobacterium attenuatum]VBA39560.1 FMN reductase (NADH) NtaB [Mycobacterium attenuatum]
MTNADTPPLLPDRHGSRPPGGCVDSTSMRNTMGAFPSGVTVLTARLGDRSVGVTISSFASVSIDPPLLLQCVARTAGSLPAFRMGSPVAVNVLARDQAGLARRFASKVEDRFAGVEFGTDADGCPVLAGAAAWISGFIDRIYDAGDHVILLIRAGSVHRSGSLPLLYYSGRMHDWSDTVRPVTS